MSLSALLVSILLVNLTLLEGPELRRQVNPSVFRLQVELDNGDLSWGTGFLISASGWLVTNNHVIDGARRVVAEDEGRFQVPVKQGFYARDPFHDLAIIQLDLDKAPEGFVPIPLSLARDTQDLDGGYEVYILGHPEGIQIAEFTRGYLTAIEPEPRRLRFDASIHNGSSGSPMFDGRNGNVIGVVTSFWTGGKEINYATPVEYLHRLKDNLDSKNPKLLPFRTPVDHRGRPGRDAVLPVNLAVSLVFFLLVIFGVRRLLRTAKY